MNLLRLAPIAALLLYRRRGPSLEGWRALVTGGTRGLGLELARQLVRRGARVAVCGRDLRELEAAHRELGVLAFQADVASHEDCARLVDQAAHALGGLDLLVNNASVIQVGPAETMTRGDFERAMATNFWGTVDCTRAALRWLRASGGRVVNITSIGGKLAAPHLLPYDCAKFAVVGFSEGLGAELRKEGVSVTTIVPGLLRTGSAFNASFKGDAPAEATWFGASDATPLTTISARRAARRILLAAARREREVTLGLPAKVARLVVGLTPSLAGAALSLVDRLLPRGTGRKARLGRDVLPRFVRRLLAPAVRRYHQELAASTRTP
jgi:NAD(P)-dependent dehydrogenase (short-subunit alcohol dehydrogenase family)